MLIYFISMGGNVERKRERTVEWQHEGGNGDSGDSLLLLFRCAGRYQV